jgi:hypothetical protein
MLPLQFGLQNAQGLFWHDILQLMKERNMCSFCLVLGGSTKHFSY